MNLLRTEQQAFDKQYFDRASWDVLQWRDQKTRHILEYVTKAQHKLIAQHVGVVMDEVVPDLAIWRTQLMNTFDLGDGVITGAPKTRPFTHLTQAYPGIMRAAGALGYYIEPLERGGTAETAHIEQAATQLHATAVGLAGLYLLDLEQTHRNRLNQLAETAL